MSFEKNEFIIKDLFNLCTTPEERYKKIIEIGRTTEDFPSKEKIDCNLVHGCQSILYLNTTHENGLMQFRAYSEALISNGLGALLCQLYSNLPPKTLVEKPPLILKELGILSSLSPTRAGGVKSLYEKMIKDSIPYIM